MARSSHEAPTTDEHAQALAGVLPSLSTLGAKATVIQALLRLRAAGVLSFLETERGLKRKMQMAIEEHGNAEAP